MSKPYIGSHASSESFATGVSELHQRVYPNSQNLLAGKDSNNQFFELLSLESEIHSRTLMYEAPEKRKYGIIGSDLTKKKRTTLSDMRSRSEGFSGGEGMALGGLNLFFTPNEFFNWRCKEQLCLLRANYLDIDTPSHEKVSNEQSQAMLDNALSQLKAKNIPSPNAIVSSGSGGWHLYWVYSPVKAYISRQMRWRAIAAKILSAIKSNDIIKVDSSASCNPVGFLRLPGSFHQKAQANCRCVYVDDDLYDFDLLERSLEIESDASQFNKNKTTRVQKRHKTFKDGDLPKFQLVPSNNKPRHTLRHYWSKIYKELIGLALQGKVSKAHRNRDNFLFMTMVALQHIKGDNDAALAKVKILNEQFRLFDGKGRDSDPQRVDDYLRSCMNVRYKFSKETLILWFKNIFDVSITRLFAWKTPPLTAEELQKRQSQSATKTHLMRKGKTILAITDAIKRLHADGIKPSMHKVATLAGISKRTVVNHSKHYHMTVGEICSLSI